ncbi:MAG: hypothetical protein D6B26_01610, partial [Spirochaetaceae bacterium]
QEESIILEIGEFQQTEGGIGLTLLESRELYNDKNDLTGWESILEIHTPGKPAYTGRTAINRPLRIFPYRLYQTDWSRRKAVTLQSLVLPEHQITLAEQEGFMLDGTLWLLTYAGTGESGKTGDPSEPALANFFFLGQKDGVISGRMSVEQAGESLQMQAVSTGHKIISGLRLSYDPGALPAGFGALMLVAGAFLSAARMRRKKVLIETGGK